MGHGRILNGIVLAILYPGAISDAIADAGSILGGSINGAGLARYLANGILYRGLLVTEFVS